MPALFDRARFGAADRLYDVTVANPVARALARLGMRHGRSAHVRDGVIATEIRAACEAEARLLVAQRYPPEQGYKVIALAERAGLLDLPRAAE